MRYVVLIVALLLPLHSTTSQSTSSLAAEQWIKDHAEQLRDVEPGGDATDLDAIRRMIGASRLVLLGEPAHGAHEPLAFRNRLFQYLVEHAGFTAIALETGMPEARALQTFIDGGPGQADTVARRNFTWGFGTFHENMELLEWMRSYNRRVASTDRLRIYGIDMPGSDQDADRVRLERATGVPLLWLQRMDSSAANRLRARLEVQTAPLNAARHADLDAVQRDALSATIGDLIAELERNRTHPLAVAAPDDFPRVLQAASGARQLDAFWRSMPPPSAAAGIPPGVWRPITSRDGAMADNVAWALAQEPAHGRLMVFAHNSHVMNAEARGGAATALATPPPMMGRYLRTRFGGEAFMVGVSAGAHGPGLAQAALDSTGIDALLARIAVRRFVVDLRPALSQPAVAQWLRTPRALRLNYTQHLDVPVITAFDALVFVDTLTPAHRGMRASRKTP